MNKIALVLLAAGLVFIALAIRTDHRERKVRLVAIEYQSKQINRPAKADRIADARAAASLYRPPACFARVPCREEIIP